MASPTLADLAVKYWTDGPGLVGFNHRPATREDIIAILGGEEVWWCKAHTSASVTPGYRCDHYRHLRATGNEGSPCRMVKRLIIPIEESNDR